MQGLQKHFSGREPESGSHHLEQLLVACTGFLIGESRLHIEFHAEHRAPGSEVLEQHHAAYCFADHYATASLRAVGAADQWKMLTVTGFAEPCTCWSSVRHPTKQETTSSTTRQHILMSHWLPQVNAGLSPIVIVWLKKIYKSIEYSLQEVKLIVQINRAMEPTTGFLTRTS